MSLEPNMYPVQSINISKRNKVQHKCQVIRGKNISDQRYKEKVNPNSARESASHQQ